ncbi:MAG: hypothetical protein LBQ90_07150 [Synergistaceae bacterium]|jgi:hypothetical protein|nr:hypothetical protein [Synergistaceae bacterium]
MPNFVDLVQAEHYLEHRYPELPLPELPLPDEEFTNRWEEWLGRSPGGSPLREVEELLSAGGRIWLEKTPAGRIPVMHTSDRKCFERLVELLRQKENDPPLPGSVNAFTLISKHPALQGHRVILLHRAGYSSLSGSDFGIPEDEWLERSDVLRLHHECCHYFVLRVLGSMRNHVLDEIVADCVGQLAAFGTFSASMQRKFFGLTEAPDEEGVAPNGVAPNGVAPSGVAPSGIAPGGRLTFYVKNLSDGATAEVCRRVNESLTRLETFLRANASLTGESERPALILKLAASGAGAMAES